MRNVCPHCKAKFRLGGRPTAIAAGAGKSWHVLSSVFRCPRCGHAMRQAAGAQIAAVLAVVALVLSVGGWLFQDQLVGTWIEAALFHVGKKGVGFSDARRQATQVGVDGGRERR